MVIVLNILYKKDTNLNNHIAKQDIRKKRKKEKFYGKLS